METRHRSARCVAALLLTLAVIHPSATAAANPIEGVRFSERVEAGDDVLTLHGTGLLRYRLFIKAYVAALYLPPAVSSERVLEDVPKRLEIEYFWDLDGTDIALAGEQLVRAGVDADTFAGLRDRLTRMSALYEDVVAGDRYALTYRPDLGTELSKNGRHLGTIPGADFAAAYFGIWLGDAPLDDALRDQLLAPR
jgi:hypothetical protein